MKRILILIIISISITSYASDLDDQLFDAFENNDINLLKELIEKGADVNVKNEQGWPFL